MPACYHGFWAAGHTASWGKGYPELLTDCYDAQERPIGVKGPINPARNETYALLWKLLREAAALFPDSYIHLGGDEVPFDCWQVTSPHTLILTTMNSPQWSSAEVAARPSLRTLTSADEE